MKRSARLRSAVRLFAIAAVAIVTLSPVVAQSLLYVVARPIDTVSPSTLVELPLTPAGPGAIRRQVVLPGPVSRFFVTSGGRYVVALLVNPYDPYQPPLPYRRLAIFDIRTGDTSILQTPTIPTNDWDREWIVDPTAARVFMIAPLEGIRILDSGGLRTIPVPGILSGAVLSSDGRDLFVPRTEAGSEHVAVLDPLTGAERRRLPCQTPLGPLSEDGQRFYVVEAEAVVVRDATTCAVLQRRDGLLIPEVGVIKSIGPVVLDEVNGRIFLSESEKMFGLGAPRTGRVRLLDLATLADVGSGKGVAQVGVDPSQGLVVNVSNGSWFPAGICYDVTAEVWAATNTPIFSWSAAVGSSDCLMFALATPPGAPRGLSAQVTGRRVTLTWSVTPGAVEYELEAGTAPGLANLVRSRIGATPSFVADPVPAGAYYVRVRAVNERGVGPASREVVVVVIN